MGFGKFHPDWPEILKAVFRSQTSGFRGNIYAAVGKRLAGYEIGIWGVGLGIGGIKAWIEPLMQRRKVCL
jgi:hypothetical protein